MKCIIFIAALVSIAAAKKPHKDKCQKMEMRCSKDRNLVQMCIEHKGKNSWQTLDWCKTDKWDLGTCSEVPKPACRLANSTVEPVWEPAPLPAPSSTEGFATVVVSATPSGSATGVPALKPAPWADEPAW